MMARIYVDQLSTGQRVTDQVFLVRTKDLRTASNGKKYIHLVLGDRTGRLPGRMWDASESDFNQIPEGGYLRFTGRCENYRGNPQFIVDGFRPADPDSLDMSDFVPRTPGDVETMWKEVKAALRTIKNRDLLALIKQFVTDDAFVQQFKQAPAAMERHHAYLGGLLEHTHSVLRLVQAICPVYPHLSSDLMIAGAFLHDVGKIAEIEAGAALNYTDDGMLVGHLVRGAIWIEQRVVAVEADTGQPFPADLKEVLQHIVLAHHGEQQFGSPKSPAVAEAFALHYLDNLDAKLHQVFRHIDTDPDATSDWTQYVRPLGTRLLKRDVSDPDDDA
jgi:3'-5' exoribonuclease